MTTEIANVEKQNQEVAKLQEDDLLALQKMSQDNAQFNEIVTASMYLPYLQLCSSSSAAVKEMKVPAGVWAIVQSKSHQVLTNEIRAYIVAMRLKASDFKTTPPTSYFDVEDPKFKEIHKIAIGTVKMTGKLSGPEFLLYLPIEKQFVTYHMANPTARRESPKARLLIGQLITLKIVLCKNKEYTWQGPQVSKCEIPGIPPLPPASEVLPIVKRFMNPPKIVVEVASDEEKAATNREDR